MGTNLNRRLQALERCVDQDAGCPTCKDVMLYGLGDDEPWPSWLDGRSCCVRCGHGVKVLPQELIDLLA